MRSVLLCEDCCCPCLLLTVSFFCRSLFSSRCLQRCLQFTLRLFAVSDRSEQRSRPLGLRPRYGAGSPASSPSLLAFGPRQGCSWPCGYSQWWRQASAPVVNACRILRYLKTLATRLSFTALVQYWHYSDTGCSDLGYFSKEWNLNLACMCWCYMLYLLVLSTFNNLLFK